MIRKIDIYADYFAGGSGEWPEKYSNDFHEIYASPFDDPDKAFGYIVLALSRSDDASFLGLLGAGQLEDLLVKPSVEILARVVAEARKSARFRWLLGFPWKIAISDEAWAAITKFRITGPRKDTLPPRALD